MGLVAVAALVAAAVLVLRQDTVGAHATATQDRPETSDDNTPTPDPNAARTTLTRSTSVGDLLGLRSVTTTLTLTAGGSTAEATIWRLGGAGSAGVLDLLCFYSVDTAEHSGDQPSDPHVAVTVDARRVTFTLTPHDGPADTITAPADGCSTTPGPAPKPDTTAPSAPQTPTPDTSSPSSGPQKLLSTASCAVPPPAIGQRRATRGRHT